MIPLKVFLACCTLLGQGQLEEYDQHLSRPMCKVLLRFSVKRDL